MNESPRHVISRVLDEHCDKLHPEQARSIIQALDVHGWAIVPKEPQKDKSEDRPLSDYYNPIAKMWATRKTIF